MTLLDLLVDLASMGRCRSTKGPSGLRCQREAGHCGWHRVDGDLGSAGTHVHTWPNEIRCSDEYPVGPYEV